MCRFCSVYDFDVDFDPDHHPARRVGQTFESPVTFESVVASTNPLLLWKDISKEEWRQYDVVSGDYLIFQKINNPVAISYTATEGAHRIVDSTGVAHYIPTGWIQLTWKSDPVVNF